MITWSYGLSSGCVDGDKSVSGELGSSSLAWTCKE